MASATNTEGVFPGSGFPSAMVDDALLISDASDSLADMTLAAIPTPGTANLSTAAPERVGGQHRYQQQPLQLQANATADGNTSTSEDTYHLIVDAIQDYAIFMLDVDGYVLTWNNGAHRLKRYNAQEIIGRHFSVFYTQEDLQTRKPERALEIALAQGRVEDEFWRVRKDGSRFWASVIITALHKDGRHVGFAKVTRDLTERYMSNLAVRQAYETAERIKSSFLSTASHELRSPLNGVLAGIQLLETMQPTSEQTETVRIIQQAGKSLLRIIDDILVHSKLEANKLALSRGVFDIHDIVKILVETYRLQSDTRLQSFIDRSVPATAIGDATRFTQVMSNLMDNAIKFTNGGSIKLELTASPPKPGPEVTTFTLTTTITDTGIGMNARDLAKLFQPFTQVDTSYSKRPGTGLGLSICKDLIKLMNGEINVTSEPGKGTRVMYTLELEWDPSTGAGAEVKHLHSAASRASEVARSARILIAEDNPINATLLMRLLRKYGFENVHHSKDGLDTVESFFALQPDIVLMDVHMPRLDGYEATKQIRASDRHTPIVAVTANASREDHALSLAAGMNGHVAKPFDIIQLMRIIEELLSGEITNPDA